MTQYIIHGVTLSFRQAKKLQTAINKEREITLRLSL